MLMCSISADLDVDDFSCLLLFAAGQIVKSEDEENIK